MASSKSNIDRTLSQGWFSSFLPNNQLICRRGKSGCGLLHPLKSQESIRQPDVLQSPRGSSQSLTGRQFTERDIRDCKVIERLVENYFGIVRKSIQDLVPKAIMHCMVNFVKENIQREFVEILYKSDNHENLLQEPENISIFREEQTFLLKSLEDAEGIINDIRDVLP